MKYPIGQTINAHDLQELFFVARNILWKSGRIPLGNGRYDIAKILEKPESWCNNDGLIANKLVQGLPGPTNGLSFISGESHERGS
jgi:hypothetical protein